MRQLFLATELTNLLLAETEQEFELLNVFRKLVDAGLIAKDVVVIVTSSGSEGVCEKIEVTPLRWSRLRRHDFFSYMPELAAQYGIDKKNMQENNVGVQGESPCPKPPSKAKPSPPKPRAPGEPCRGWWECTQKAMSPCFEDGQCRRQGVDLISPCTTDS